MSLAAIRRGLLVLLLDAGILLLLSEVLSGFVLDGAATTLGAAVLIGLLNAFVWPTLARLALPLTVLTLGIAPLILNGLLVTIAVDLDQDRCVSDVGDGVGAGHAAGTLLAAAATRISVDLIAVAGQKII